MNKPASTKRLIITILLIFIAIFGVYLGNVSNSLNFSDSCDLTLNACEQHAFNERVRAKFEQAPITEEELFITFSSSESISIQNAWVEGVNMYMGKTPVLFEDPSQAERAVIFLGSCNLQEMQWQLNVNVKNNATSEVALLQYKFYTYQSQ